MMETEFDSLDWLNDLWYTVSMKLDREKTELQETGLLSTLGMTLAEVIEVVTDLGIDPREVLCYDKWIVTKNKG